MQDLSEIIAKLSEVRDHAVRLEKQFEETIRSRHPKYQNAARNLIHYIALRSFSLADVREKLSLTGVSSLPS